MKLLLLTIGNTQTNVFSIRLQSKHLWKAWDPCPPPWNKQTQARVFLSFLNLNVDLKAKKLQWLQLEYMSMLKKMTNEVIVFIFVKVEENVRKSKGFFFLCCVFSPASATLNLLRSEFQG